MLPIWAKTVYCESEVSPSGRRFDLYLTMSSENSASGRLTEYVNYKKLDQYKHEYLVSGSSFQNYSYLSAYAEGWTRSSGEFVTMSVSSSRQIGEVLTYAGEGKLVFRKGPKKEGSQVTTSSPNHVADIEKALNSADRSYDLPFKCKIQFQ